MNIYSLAYSSTIEIVYWGDIDKPIPTLLIQNNDLDYDIKYEFSSGVGHRVNILVPSTVYNDILTTILNFADVLLLNTNSYFICKTFDTRERYCKVSVNKMIQIIAHLISIIEYSTIDEYLNDYIKTLDLHIRQN
jgi:hypothetical protein